MKTLFLALMLLSASVPRAVAQDWAIDGLDAVDFVERGRLVPGRGDIATQWKGQVWHFATEDNRNRFEADPRSFAPAFKGLCPVALAQGRHVPGSPRHGVVIADRLYLTGSSRAEQELRHDPRTILARAKANWDR